MRLYFGFLLLVGSLFGKEILYLTWQEDPTSTIVVHRILEVNKGEPFYIKKVDEPLWSMAKGTSRSLLDFSPYIIETIFLSDLEQNTKYEGRFGEEGQFFRFRTAPKKLNQEEKFVFGGDFAHDNAETSASMNRRMATFSPLAAILGGDLAYSFIRNTEAKENKERWLDWLKIWSETMRTPEGFMIPMIPALGNHEVGLPLFRSFRTHPLFFDLFALEDKKSYRKILFGDWLALYILDTGHVQSITGPQLNWLLKESKERTLANHKIAVYHVPAWPAYRSLSGATSNKIRRNWVPLFEKMGIEFAFEHHDHLYKRTAPLLEGHKDPKGVVYIGAGAWGGANHAPQPKRPYIEKALPAQSAVLAEISFDKIVLKAISTEGEILDEYSR